MGAYEFAGGLFSLDISEALDGVTDPPAGNHWYVANSAVLVTAVPDGGWRFDHWTGDFSGSDNPLTVRMTGNWTLGAVFLGTPIADFDAVPLWGKPPLEVHFSDLSSPGVSPTNGWQWTFGDGQGSVEENPVHTYAECGAYSVTLEVENDCGASSKTRQIIVTLETLPLLPFPWLILLVFAAAIAGFSAVARSFPR